ncbi:hypothetical protein Zmor_016851 [Zophobas morio]|uniref:Uncharacterized protein n=1 Tax=Zophobas morio TaxID=2755281 RepID=A0AA38IAB7_9CUCU|nr:hypothetical protein Zmor_016851 [Zophobas morio]
MINGRLCVSPLKAPSQPLLQPVTSSGIPSDKRRPNLIKKSSSSVMPSVAFLLRGSGGRGRAAVFRNVPESVTIDITETIKLSVASEQGIKALRLATGLHDGINNSHHYH